MEKDYLAPGLVVYRNVIKDYEGLVAGLEEAVNQGCFSWGSAKLGSGSKLVINKDIRDTDLIVIPYNNHKYKNIIENNLKNNLRKIFFKSFDLIEKDYMKEYNESCLEHENYSVLRYNKGQKFTKHSDSYGSYTRKISTAYYLNENYSGGEVVFPYFNITYKPKANDMLIFPSIGVYSHHVSEVTNGTRYSVVSWLGSEKASQII